MKLIIGPFVKLMNQLNYAYKFSLINVMFLLPLLVLSYGLVENLESDIEATESQIEGLHMMHDVYELLDQVSRYRDLKSADVYQANPEIAPYLAEVEAGVDSLMAKLAEWGAPKWDEYGRIPLQMELMQESWEKLKADNQREYYVDQQYKRYHEMIVPMIRMLKTVAKSSGLAKSSDPAVFSLQELLIRIYPEFSSITAQARASALVGISAGFLDSSTADQLNFAYEGFLESINRFKKDTTELLEEDPRLQRALAEPVANMQGDFEEMLVYMDDKLIAAMQLEVGWKEFFVTFTGYLDKSFAVTKNDVLPFMERVLERRLDEQSSSLRFFLIIISVLLIVILLMFLAFYLSVNDTITRFRAAATKVSNGDMKVRLTLNTKDEMGQLATEFNTMVQRIHDLIQAVSMTVVEVDTQSSKLESISKKSKTSVDLQMQETEQVTVAVNEVTAQVQNVEDNAGSANKAAENAQKEARLGGKQVDGALKNIDLLASEINNSMQVINRVAKDSANISQVLDVIKGIAEQTNLLALNAAIEAARAGELGRGFAVVADEVRTLAQRTQSSTEEIEGMINRLQSGVKDAVGAMEVSHERASQTVDESGKVGEVLHNIEDMIETIAAMNQQISSACSEQTNVMVEIDQNINSIAELSQQTSEDAEGTERASAEMSQLTGSLQQLISAFKV